MKKIKIPYWALLKKTDLKWVSYSCLGWLVEKNYLSADLVKAGYYYSHIMYQYEYHNSAPRLKISKTFDLQTILFGRSLYKVSDREIEKSLKIFKHWNHIDLCLKPLAQERCLIEPLLKKVLKDNTFPNMALQKWVPFFKKGLKAIDEGIQ